MVRKVLTNSRQTLSKLLPDEKGVIRIDTPGGPQSTNIINKDGLYRLIFRSNKREADFDHESNSTSLILKLTHRVLI